MNCVTSTKIPVLTKLFSGKVRDIYEYDENHLLIISTDRISAFDFVFPEGIPGKGIILNQISNLWFNNIASIKNHLVDTNFDNFPKKLHPFEHLLRDRSAIVKKAKKIDFECIARGYIIGSGWKDYLNTGEICGISLPSNMKLADKLFEPIFTPSTKATEGHDENISFDTMSLSLGVDLGKKIKNETLKIYEFAEKILHSCGIILADTKIEFGIIDNEVILIDEVLTPDSSRFWDKNHYKPGTSPVSFDKQFIRDYLESTNWDKKSSPPSLPDDIIKKTYEKYSDIYEKIKSIIK